MVRTPSVLYILTWKCASRHNGVHFFDIWTSKSGPELVCFVHFDLEMCFAPQRRALFQHLDFQKWSEHGVLCTFWLGNVLRATTASTFSTSEPPKVVRTPSVLYILTWKCASRHNGVHFFNILTSKSGPRMVCFVHFDFEMCFAPQRRALFRHLNFQKWSGAGVFCTFWLGNVLRATTACTFSTSQLPKVVRDRQFLTLLTSKCASRHNGVQFFIAPVASWLRTRRFSEPTFRPSGATDHWKNTVFRDFPTFSRICIFCLLTLSLLIFSLLIFLFSLPLPCSAFHLSILSEVWLLNFLRLTYRDPPLPRKKRSFWEDRSNNLKNDSLCSKHVCFWENLRTKARYTNREDFWNWKKNENDLITPSSIRRWYIMVMLLIGHLYSFIILPAHKIMNDYG